MCKYSTNTKVSYNKLYCFIALDLEKNLKDCGYTAVVLLINVHHILMLLIISMMNDHVCIMQEYKLKQSNNIYIDQADNIIQ